MSVSLPDASMLEHFNSGSRNWVRVGGCGEWAKEQKVSRVDFLLTYFAGLWDRLINYREFVVFNLFLPIK